MKFWKTISRTGAKANPQASDVEVGDGVYFNAVEDAIVLRTGESSDLIVLGGIKELHEAIGVGLAAESARAGRQREAQVTPCRWCGRPIRWVRIEGGRKQADEWLALDEAPHRHGTILLSLDGTRARAVGLMATSAQPLYQAHVMSCAGMATGQRRFLGPERKEGEDDGATGDQAGAGDDHGD